LSPSAAKRNHSLHTLLKAFAHRRRAKHQPRLATFLFETQNVPSCRSCCTLRRVRKLYEGLATSGRAQPRPKIKFGLFPLTSFAQRKPMLCQRALQMLAMVHYHQELSSQAQLVAEDAETNPVSLSVAQIAAEFACPLLYSQPFA
jgi:hypothetical protein